jgi:hypothetical protein
MKYLYPSYSRLLPFSTTWPNIQDSHYFTQTSFPFFYSSLSLLLLILHLNHLLRRFPMLLRIIT